MNKSSMNFWSFTFIISIHIYKIITEFLVIYSQNLSPSVPKTSMNFLSFTNNVKLKVNPALFKFQSLVYFSISLFSTLTWVFFEIWLDQDVHYMFLVNSIHCHSALKIKPREHLVHLRYVICQNNRVLY